MRNAGLLTLKSEMDSTRLLISVFIGFGFTSCSAREYHYVNQSLTWTEAQNYCREKYSDLATIESAEDLSRLNRSSVDTSFSWIGLSDDPKSWKAEGVWSDDSNSWRWSATGKTSETGYHNWDYVNYEQLRYRTCGYIWTNGHWYDESCSNEYTFVCFNDSNPPGQKTFIAVKNPMNWTEAQEYCRTHHTDLATIDNTEENTQVHSVMAASYAWIGLYRIPWRWSDNSSSSFTNWRSDEPNGGHDYCVAVDSHHFWHDLNCSIKHNFWCHTGTTSDGGQSSAQTVNDLRVKKTEVRMKIQTFADLSDPATNAQILQQLSERFKALHRVVKLRWVTQPTKQEEDDDEDDGKCN